MKVLLFAGTSEGRKIASTLSNLNIDATVCVATDYGADILSDITNINLIEKRQDQNDIENLLEIHDIVIDATHPYALDISNNILKANEVKQKKYYRIIREFV
ncbi:MAG: precorrin-6A/cobalt-precorrin-6A reductase, partial [Erysipelotrichales bacterium]